MKKAFKIAGLIILAALFIGTYVFLYNKSKKQPDLFNTTSPTIDNIVKKTVATGSVVPRKEIEIKPQVSGIVDELFVEAGMMVKTGDVLARVKIIPDMISLNGAESRVNQAKLSYDDAKINYDRQKELYDKKVIAYEEYQKAQLSFNTAREELSAAENNLELIKEGVTKKAKTATNTLIRSTIDGMVLQVPIEEGNSVIQANTFNAGTTIAIVADMGDMIFKGKIDETEVGKVREGMPMILTIGAIDEEKFDAVLTYRSPKGLEENGAIQFEIKADVKLKEGQFIRAGYSANASIVIEQRDSVLVIPEGLIQFQGDSAFVEVQVDSMVFEKRFIEVGLSDGINIEVKKGLDKTTKVKGEKIDPKAKKEAAKK